MPQPPPPTLEPFTTTIRPLVPPTIHALTSTLTLTSPLAAIKELLDNALDANATRIAIDTSPNLVDHIAVRDNGASIPPGPCRALLGRRHCTSKLRDGEGVRDVGGRTLGFRGEALAALVEVAEKVRVGVRVEGEGVGRVLWLGEGREEVGVGERGTCVRAEGLFSRWPVRRGVVVREAERGVRRVRRMLQGYAMARVGVRLELRVGKAGGKGAWVYAPKVVGGRGGEEEVVDAAWKVVGREVAAQCGYAVREVGGYRVEGFLPRADAEAKKVSGLGAFVSVDARPVSTARGTLKLVAKAFMERLKKANPAMEDVREPFFRMDIRCPPGSYDPNVEPAKDDVLFEDSGAVLGAVNEFLDAVYSGHTSAVDQAPAVAKASKAHQASVETVEDGDGDIQMDADEDDIFEQLMNLPDSDMMAVQNSEDHRSKKDALAPEKPSVSTDSSNIQSQIQEERHKEDVPQPKRQRTWKYNMFDVDEDDLLMSDTEQQNTPDETPAEVEPESTLNDITVSNPWTMARMNSKVKNTVSTALLPQRTESQVNIPTSSPQRQPHSITGYYLPTPQASSPIHGRNAFNNHTTDLNLPRDLTTPNASQFTTQAHDAHLVPSQGSTQHSDDGFFPVPLQTAQTTPLPTGTGGPKRQRSRGGFRKQQPGRGGANKPFKSPINPERDCWFSNLPPQRSKKSSVFLRRNEIPATTNNDEQYSTRATAIGAGEGSMSDGRDRDIRNWMTGNDRRTTRSSNRPTAMEINSSTGNATEISEEPVSNHQHQHPMTSSVPRIRNFEFNRPEAEHGPAPTPAAVASPARLTLQHPTSTLHPPQQQDDASRPHAEPPTPEPLRRSNRILDRAPATQHLPTEEATHNPDNARRHSTRRRTTSTLPLERVPAPAQMHNVSLTLLSAAEAPEVVLARLARGLELLDPGVNELFAWGARGMAVFGGEAVVEGEVVQGWADGLAVLLGEMVVGGEVVREDLSFVIMEAVERQRREVGV